MRQSKQLRSARAFSLTGLKLWWLVACVAAGWLAAPAATAASFVVDTLTDESDLPLNVDGTTSLREAITLANASPGTDTITFSVVGTIQLNTALGPLPTVTQSLTLNGTSGGNISIGVDGSQLASGNGFTFAGTGNTSSVQGFFIGGFPGNGIEVDAGPNVTIQGNFIGLNLSNSAFGNTGDGILIDGTGGNVAALIGGVGAAPRNVIGSNSGSGIVVQGSGASGVVVQGNYIGTDTTGSAARGNGVSGILILSGSNNDLIGGSAAGASNVIAANGQTGITINGAVAGNLVQGNLIGTNASGTAALGNGTYGVYVLGGATGNTIGGIAAGARNVISGNPSVGVYITTATGNLVQGNFIGTNATGTATVANGVWGVLIQGAGGNTIGGTSAGARNVISGNGQIGISVNGAPGNQIQGNFIGTNAAGSGALGNGVEGVYLDSSGNTVGGAAAGAGNVISGNVQVGVVITGGGGTGNLLQGNRIGTDPSGALALGNGTHGILISAGAAGNTVGGGNIIAFNSADGAALSGGVGNTITGNSIFSNGGANPTNLGIDLDIDGVTPNDPGDVDTGTNNLQNFPVLTSVAGNGQVSATLNSTANSSYAVEFFASAAASPSGFGQGEVFLGAQNVTMGGTGNVSFIFSSVPQAGRPFITATATNLGTGDTSEFSAAVARPNAPPVNSVPGAQLTNMNVPLVFATANGNRITIVDTDAGDFPVQVTLTITNGTLTLGTAAGLTGLTGNGTATVIATGSLTDLNNALNGLTYTPPAGYNGPATLTINTNDQGNTGGGGPQSALSSVPITVNAAPVANNDAYTTAEDTPLTIVAPGVLANDTDADNNALTAILVAGPTKGQFALKTDGSFTYAPAADINGTDSFTYRASDGILAGNVATVTLTITAVNDAPIAQSQTVSTNEDTPKSITLSATDVDSPALTYTIVAGPSHGTLSGTAPSLTYTPALNYNGPDVFTFKANDGLADSNVATVAVTILPVNDAPVALPDTANAVAGVSVDINVLANDSDVDGNTLSITTVGSGTGGVTSLNANGTVRYTPNASFSGIDSFSYTISDGAGGFATGTVTVTVTPAASPPLTLVLSPATCREDGGIAASTGTVTLPAPASAPLVIALSSSDAGRARVPATVTVAAGATVTTFGIEVVDNAVADGTHSVTIGAASTGFAAASASLAITDDDTPTLTLSVNADHFSEGTPGVAATATVRRNTPTGGALAVTLTSSNTLKARVPNLVTIAAGAAAATFPVTAVNNTITDGPQRVTLRATAAGFAPGTAQVTVQDNEAASNGSISGRITTSLVTPDGTAARAPVPGIVVGLWTGTMLRHAVTTAGGGLYSFVKLPFGTYTVIPQPTSNFTFVPARRIVAVTKINTPNVDFDCTPRGQIRGRVLRRFANGTIQPLAGITILTRFANRLVTARTDAGGRYVLDNLPLATHNVLPVVPHTYFQPGSRLISLTPASPAGNGADFAVAGNDALAPTIIVTRPRPGTFAGTAQPLLATGTARDTGGAGVALITVALARFTSSTATVPSGFYNWSTASFTTSDNPSLVEKLAAGTTSWTVRGLPALPAGFYGLRATAADAASNIARSAYVHWSVTATTRSAGAGDNDSPSHVQLSSLVVDAATDTVQLRFSGALDADTASEPGHYTVAINGDPVVVESAGYNDLTRTVTLGLSVAHYHAGEAVTVQWSALVDTHGDSVSGLAAR